MDLSKTAGFITLILAILWHYPLILLIDSQKILNKKMVSLKIGSAASG